MSESGESDGWAPPDRDMPGERPADPRSPNGQSPPHWQLPHGHEPSQQGPYAQGPYGQGPYAQGPHAQGPYAQGPYGQGPYAPGPYGQGPPVQGPYGQGPYGQGGYPQPYGGYGAHAVRRPWTVAPPPGTPYHHMARTEVHRWWRPLLGTLTLLGVGMISVIGLLFVATVVAWAVTGEMPDSGGDDAVIFENDTADLAINLAMLAVFLPVALFAAWAVQRRRPGTLSSVAGRLRWKWMLVCVGLAVLFCIVAFGTSLLADLGMPGTEADGDEQWVGWGEFLVPMLVIVLLVPFQATAEEYVFRGWLLQAVGACTLENSRWRIGRALSVVFRTPWPGIVIGSALFTAGHGYTGWGILDIFAFGAIAAWVTVRTGGLEAAIALHVFNNLLAFGFSAAVGELDIVQGAVPWQVMVADVVPMVLFAAAAVWLARRLGVRTVTPGAADEPPVTAGGDPARVP